MNSSPENFPKIIHQVYGFWDSKIPRKIQSRMDTWKKFHPDYEHKLWDKKTSRNFIKEHYAWFLPVYDSYWYAIQRADAIRYFFLYHYGGLYSDIDLEPLKCITPLLEKHKNKGCILYRSPNSELLTNDFMVSKARNPFWKKVWYELLVNNNFKSVSKHLTVMHTTGPLLLDSAFENMIYRRKKYVYVIHAKYINSCDIAAKKPCWNKEAYLKRYDGNSWHGADSTILNFFYKHYITIIVVVVLICVIIGLLVDRSSK